MAFAKLSARDVDFDLDGFLNASGKLYTYQAGTTTLLASYQDAEGTPNANPVIFDSSGQYHLWLLRGTAYKLVFTDADDVVLYTEDDIVLAAESSALVETLLLDALWHGNAPPTASEWLGGFSFPADVTFPINFGGAFGHINTNPTSSFVISVRKNATTSGGGTAVGTVTVDTSGVFAFATTSGTTKSFAAGDHISFWAPGSADATANDFNFTLSATVDA